MVITTNSKLHFKVNNEEAHKIDQLITSPNPPAFVEIHGSTISTDSINGFIEDSDWYASHPNERPAPKPEPFKITDVKKPLDKGGVGYRFFKMQGKRLKAGLPRLRAGDPLYDEVRATYPNLFDNK